MSLRDLSRANPPTKKEAEQVREYQRGKAKVSFYTDENFPSRATRLLSLLKARVTTAQDMKLRRHPDENHAAHALKHGHVLLTCDRDYLDERRFPLIHCPAIVVFDFRSGPCARHLAVLCMPAPDGLFPAVLRQVGQDRGQPGMLD